MEPRTKKRGARAIILREGKILLGKRLKKDSFYGLWCTFGGSVESGETPEQALIRELAEELGIRIMDPVLLTVSETVTEEQPPEAVQLHFFLVRAWKGKIVNKSEHSEIRWFHLNSLKDLPMGRVGKKVIDKYLTKH